MGGAASVSWLSDYSNLSHEETGKPGAFAGVLNLWWKHL